MTSSLCPGWMTCPGCPQHPVTRSSGSGELPRLENKTHCPACASRERAATACIEAASALLESLGEYVRQSMDANPEWNTGIRAVREALADTEVIAMRRRALGITHNECHSASDGECDWSECPQIRAGEPAKTGRHCPLHVTEDDS